MKSYTTNTPVFRDTIKITEKNDRAHADIINEAPIQTFQNTLCNRQSIEQLKQSAVSTEDYNPEVSYQVGDNCLYQNTLYKCVQETTGEWNPDCWKKTNILEEMKNLEKGVLYPEFDDSGEVEGITSFTDFLDSVVSKIPLVKFLRNFKAGMKFVLHAGQLVTDCVTDRDDLPVAACTVKNLMDLYTQLNSDHIEYWGGVEDIEVKANTWTSCKRFITLPKGQYLLCWHVKVGPSSIKTEVCAVVKSNPSSPVIELWNSFSSMEYYEKIHSSSCYISTYMDTDFWIDLIATNDIIAWKVEVMAYQIK